MFETNSFLSVMRDAEKESARRADLLLGKCEGSGRDNCVCRTCEPLSDVVEVLNNSTLSFEEKKARLQVLRGSKTAKPKSFRKRVTPTDAIHARALGIRLD